MGTSGHQVGFKAFSINTTIRNPKRNKGFLSAIQEFENTILDSNLKEALYKKIVKLGLYTFENTPNYIFQKYEQGIELNDNEVDELIRSNPQQTGEAGRLMTHIRALKDTGFIYYVYETKNKYKFIISKLGHQLLNGLISDQEIYTKSLLGLHYFNPGRTTVLNKSRPFLNTMYVIKSINEFQIKNSEKPSGITKHEFVFFVLTMPNCEYKNAVLNIIEYRRKYGFKYNKNYFKNYYDRLNYTKASMSTLMNDYSDDVFRKFEMTGLITRNSYWYVNFNSFEDAKINQILSNYRDYKWTEFDSIIDYVEYLDSITLPWTESDDYLKEVIDDKLSRLKSVPKNLISGLDFTEIESIIDTQYYTELLKENLNSFTEDFVIHEIRILYDSHIGKSKFSSIPEPLRLEWLLSILMSLKFGSNSVTANLIMNSRGEPLSHAPGNKPDIVVELKKQTLLLEPTMIKSSAQQINSETSSVARHLAQYKNGTKPKSSLMVAPYIHYDTINWYRYESTKEKIMLLPITIKKLVEIIKISENEDNFDLELENLHKKMLSFNIEAYQDFINYK